MTQTPTADEVLAALRLIERTEESLMEQARRAGITRPSVYLSEEINGTVSVRLHTNGDRCFPNHLGRYVYESTTVLYGKHFDETVEKAGKRIREKAGR